MGNNNAITCLRFEEHGIVLAKVNPLTASVTWQRTIAVDYPLLTRQGAVVDPVQTGTLLRNTVDTFKLPTGVRVAVHLNHLDLKTISLPIMPEAELQQVIQDEAARESIFSYAGGPVTVAFQPLAPSSGESTGKLSFLTATTPGEVVKSIIATMEQANLKLLSIQPTLIGLGQLITERYPDSNRPRVLLNVKESSTEFYLWQGSAPLFWRNLAAGTEQTEKLTQEIIISLEHCQRRAAMADSVRQMTVLGQPFNPVLDPEWSVDVLSGNQGLDLRGLGLQAENSMSLNFVTPAPGEGSRLVTLWQRCAVFLIGTALVFNGYLGWRLSCTHQALADLRKTQAASKDELTELQTMLSMLKRPAAPTIPLPAGMQPDALLEELRWIVPSNLRFESLALDIQAKNLQITGICLEHDRLKEFLTLAAGLASVKTLQVIETRQEQNGYYHFKITLNLEANRS